MPRFICRQAARGNAAMGMLTEGNAYFYITNLQGDITAILNSSGQVVVQYTYDAWGNPLSTTGSLASTIGALNPLRYRGYVYDTEWGLYYLQSRYYDPEIGRFICSDVYASTGQGFTGNNMFVYCNNNPVIYRDNGGEKPELSVEFTPSGYSLELKESRQTANGEVTVIINLEFDCWNDLVFYLEKNKISISPTAVEISTPDGQSASFNIKENTIQPDSAFFPFSEGDNFGMVATEDGVGYLWSAEYGFASLELYILYKITPISVLINNLSRIRSSTVACGVGGYSGAKVNSSYTSTAFRSKVGCDLFSNMMFIYR